MKTLLANYRTTRVKLSMSIANLACNSNLPIKYNDMPLQFESSTQFLGDFLGYILNFYVHINHVCQKVSNASGILFRTKDLLPVKVINPYLTNCITVWKDTYGIHLNPL